MAAQRRIRAEKRLLEQAGDPLLARPYPLGGMGENPKTTHMKAVIEQKVIEELRRTNFDAGIPFDRVAETIIGKYGQNEAYDLVIDSVLEPTRRLLELVPADTLQVVLKHVRDARDLQSIAKHVKEYAKEHPGTEFTDLDYAALLHLRLLRVGKTIAEVLIEEGRDRLVLGTGIGLMSVATALGLHGHVPEREPVRPVIEHVEPERKPQQVFTIRSAQLETGGQTPETVLTQTRLAQQEVQPPEQQEVQPQTLSSDDSLSFRQRWGRIRADPKNLANYGNLLTEGEFVFANQMSASDIQGFFENTPYGRRCFLADYRVNGISAAQMIFNAAQEANVNPQLLIARLQVEQGLIGEKLSWEDIQARRKTDKRFDRRWTRKLDWALGMGATDKGRVERYRGFGTQVAESALTLRRLHDEYNQYDDDHSVVRMNYSTRARSKRLRAENAPSYAVLRYTPHSYDIKLRNKRGEEVIGGGNYSLMRTLEKFSFLEEQTPTT